MEELPRKQRLSRAESKARTRQALIDAAAMVFARHGYNGASIDTVAETAGYTKGAVYAHFEGKEDLFLALVDRQLQNDHGGLEAMIESGEPFEAMRESIDSAFAQELENSRDWAMLSTEFFLHAMRDERIRAKLAARIRTARDGYRACLERRIAATGRPTAMPPELAAAAFLAFENGLSLLALIDDDPAIRRLYGTVLQKLLE